MRRLRPEYHRFHIYWGLNSHKFWLLAVVPLTEGPTLTSTLIPLVKVSPSWFNGPLLWFRSELVFPTITTTNNSCVGDIIIGLMYWYILEFLTLLGNDRTREWCLHGRSSKLGTCHSHSRSLDPSSLCFPVTRDKHICSTPNVWPSPQAHSHGTKEAWIETSESEGKHSSFSL